MVNFDYTYRGARLRQLSAVLLMSTLFSGGAWASTLWDYTGVGDAPMGMIAPGGGFPNALTFTVDGKTVTASAWSDTGSGNTFEGATIGREWTGLGSCNVAEVTGDCVTFPSPDYTRQVDNQAEQEWVLLVFDNTYNFESLIHQPFGESDRDASYWIGNIDPGQNLAGLTYGDLAGIGFGDRIDVSADVGLGSVTIDFGGATGNAILIGAAFGQNDDRLKLSSVQASVVPLPASAWMLLSALSLLFWMRSGNRIRTDSHSLEMGRARAA